MSSPVLSAAAPAPRRPAGLILAAIVLALMACWGLLTSGFVIYVGVAVHTPQTAQYPAIAAMQIAMGIVMLLASCFCALTVYGLFRVQRWARFSMIILGGLLALTSAAFALLFVAFGFSPALTRTSGANVSPAFLKLLFFGMGAFAVGVSCVGVWWFIYFNLRRIRMLFQRKIEGASIDGVSLELAADAWANGTEPDAAPIAHGAGVVEILLNCLAVLYLIGAASGVVVAALKMPIFLLGVIFRGVSASVLLLALSALNLAIGVGILQRMKAAWFAALGFQLFGWASALVLLLPLGRAGMLEYQNEITRYMFDHIHLPQASPQVSVQGASYLPSVILGVAITGGIFWLLVRARPLFEARRRVS